MTDFFELLKKRRCIREFEDKDVSLEIVNEVIKESCMAPSSANGQPWRFIIVNNKDMIKRLSDESKKNILSYIEKNPDSPSKKKWWRKNLFFFHSKPRGHLFRTIYPKRSSLSLFLVSLYSTREKRNLRHQKRFPVVKERETFSFSSLHTVRVSEASCCWGPF